jgi:hypothetical protein
MTREELIARRDELAIKEAGIRQQQNDLEVARVLAVGARMEVERMLRVEDEKEKTHGQELDQGRDQAAGGADAQGEGGGAVADGLRAEPPDESGHHGATSAPGADTPEDAAEPVGASPGYAI